LKLLRGASPSHYTESDIRAFSNIWLEDYEHKIAQYDAEDTENSKLQSDTGVEVAGAEPKTPLSYEGVPDGIDPQIWAVINPHDPPIMSWELAENWSSTQPESMSSEGDWFPMRWNLSEHDCLQSEAMYSRLHGSTVNKEDVEGGESDMDWSDGHY
jgi:hypothetical protein